jgi:hypothetical protein
MSDRMYQRALDLYGDEELAQAVYEDMEARATTPKVEAGELQLPHPADARKWLDRKMGRDNQTPSEREAHRRISELEARLAQLGGKDDPQAPT